MQINKLQFIFWMQTVILKYSLTSCKDSYLHKVIHFDFGYISSILKYKLQLTLLLLYDLEKWVNRVQMKSAKNFKKMCLTKPNDDNNNGLWKKLLREKRKKYFHPEAIAKKSSIISFKSIFLWIRNEAQ